MSDIVERPKYTGPSEFVHLHSHTILSVMDGVATPQQYAAECHKRGYPAMTATEHGHMASVPDMYLAFREYGIKYFPGCFLPNQAIYTSTGVKQFCELTAGDNVLTHTGKFEPVLNVQVRSYNGELVRLKAWGVEDQVATPEHPFLVREVCRKEVRSGVWSESINTQFMPAGDLFREKYNRTYATQRSKDRSNKRRYRYYLCVPRLNGNGLSKLDIRPDVVSETHDSSLIMAGDNIVSVIHSSPGYRSSFDVNIPALIDLDHDLLWIMGLWLAEGSVKNGELMFSLSADEYHFYERIADYFARFDINTSYRMRNGNNEQRPRDAMDVSVYSVYFGRMFKRLFGEHFDKKRIPHQWLIELNSCQSSSLLHGLLDGDAKRSERISYLKLNNQTLVWQARLLMTKLEEPQTSAITQISCNNSDNISHSLHFREAGHFYYDYDDLYIYLPVYAVSRERYDGLVYNAEVANDNSYYTGVAVHNCEIYFNDYDVRRREIESTGTKVRSKAWRADNPELASRIARNRHLTVLCKNQTGYENLIKLTTDAYRDGLFGMGRNQFNRISFDKLCQHKEGLIVLSGCLNGPVCHELRFRELKNKEGEVIFERKRDKCLADALKYVKKFKSAFGSDYYIELQMPGIEDDHKVFHELIAIAEMYKIPTVLTNDSHYLQRADYELQTIMMAVAQGVTVDSKDLFHVNSSEQYMKTREELWQRYMFDGLYSQGMPGGLFEEMCNNTLKIADQCMQLEVDTSPKIPETADSDNELRRIVGSELQKRGLSKIDQKFVIDGREVTYTEQAEIELQRFIDKGFANYFLITRDLVQFGKRHGWPFSPRGSAGGSLVCFLLDIHVLDPMKWGLSFDRFLSPSRGGYMLNVKMAADDEVSINTTN